MAITTLDGVLAGAIPPRYFTKAATGAARLQSSWAQTGLPAAGVPSGSINGATYTAPIQGQLPHTDPGSGNSYLSRATFTHLSGTTGGWAMLCDRIWDNGGIDVTITTAQTISTSVWPARDAVGGTTGVGVLLAVEVSVATGAGTPTLTVSYTNSAGTAGRTGSNIGATAATLALGNTFLISLQAGDLGVRSVQSITLSATWTTGTINLVAFRPLAGLLLGVNSGSVDCITGGFARLYNGVVPYWLYQLNTASSFATGTYVESQG